MIIDKLAECYDLLLQDDTLDVPMFGYSKKRLSSTLIITLDTEGYVVSCVPFKPMKEKGKDTRMTILMPYQGGRSGKNADAYALVDNTSYILGKQVDGDKTMQHCKARAERFYTVNATIFETSSNPVVQAMLTFMKRILADEDVHYTFTAEDIDDRPLVLFKLEGVEGYLHEQADVLALWESYYKEMMIPKGMSARCVVTNELTDTIANTHTPILGVAGGQASGVALVTFNGDAYTSYGNTQGYNCPVSYLQMFKYTTALMTMLDYTNGHKCAFGDTTVLFWTDKTTQAIEHQVLKAFLNPFDWDAETSEVEVADKDKAILNTLKSISKAQLTEDDLNQFKDTKLYILGLTPNNARVSIDFFLEDTYGDFIANLQKHYQNLALNITVGADNKYGSPPSVTDILKAMTRDIALPSTFKTDRTALLQTILFQKPYARQMFQSAITRYRIDTLLLASASSLKNAASVLRANYVRLCLMKAYLINHKQEAITMSLNPQNTNVGYLLGRLFAVLEKVQSQAGNSTLVTTYFSGASTMPNAIFTQLLRNYQYNINKLKKSAENSRYSGYYDKLATQIQSDIPAIPTRFTLEEQGQFMLGYAQQKQDFYTKKETTQESISEKESENE